MRVWRMDVPTLSSGRLATSQRPSMALQVSCKSVTAKSRTPPASSVAGPQPMRSSGQASHRHLSSHPSQLCLGSSIYDATETPKKNVQRSSPLTLCCSGAWVWDAPQAPLTHASKPPTHRCIDVMQILSDRVFGKAPRRQCMTRASHLHVLRVANLAS